MMRLRFFGFALLMAAVPALAQNAAQNNQGRGPGPGRGAFPPVVIGPPAPVPPEVAIPRPTPDELAKVNDAVTNWIASDKSSARPLLEKFQSLLMLQPPRLNVAATYTQTVQRMGPRHLGFVETAQKGNIDFLLEGDSITDWWVQGDENKAMFEKYFGNMRTANFAIAGDTTLYSGFSRARRHPIHFPFYNRYRQIIEVHNLLFWRLRKGAERFYILWVGLTIIQS